MNDIEYGELTPLDESPSAPSVGPTVSVPKKSSLQYGELTPIQDEGADVPQALQGSRFKDVLTANLTDPSDPAKNFDRAVEVSGGDVAWALRTFKGVDPDTAVKIDSLAKRHYGASTTDTLDFALKTQKDLEEADTVKSILDDLTRVDSNGEPLYPLTRKWMTDPLNASKSRDDVKALTLLEDDIRQNRRRKDGTDKSWLSDKLSRFGESVADTLAMSGQGVAQSGSDLQSSDVPKVVGSIGQFADPSGGDFKYAMGEISTWLQEMAGQNDQWAKQNLGIDTSEKSPIQKGLKWVADRFGSGREKIKEFFNEDPNRDPDLSSKVASGLGNVAASLPMYALPPLGVSATVGQMYQSQYDDAKASGATDIVAHEAGLENIPAAALEVIADKFLIGRVIPQGTKITKTIVAKAIAESAASEGITEGVQQVWSNRIAQGLYDVERKLSEGVMESVIVGGIVGGGVTSMGQGVAKIQERFEVRKTKATDEAMDLTRKLDHLESIKNIANQSNLLKRDPESVEAFHEGVEQTIIAAPEMIDVSPAQVVTLFQSDPQNPEAIGQFAESIGVTSEEFQKAIQSGSDVQVPLSKLTKLAVSNPPVYDSIIAEYESRIEQVRERVKADMVESQNQIAQLQTESVIPEKLKQIRTQLMAPKEGGGFGLKAKDADAQMAVTVAGLQNIAKNSGETIEQTVDRLGLDVVIGGDGKGLVNQANQGEIEVRFQPSHEEQNADNQFVQLAGEAATGNREFRAPILVGKVPSILKALGASDSPVVINQSVIEKARDIHEFDFKNIEKLPQSLRDPLLVFKSKMPNAYNVVLPFANRRGEPAVAAIHLDKKIGRYVIHEVATISQRGIGQMQDWISLDLLEYMDKKRTVEASFMNGLQLPALTTPRPSGGKILSKEDLVNKNSETRFQGDQNPRGAVQFNNDTGKAIIYLLEKSDNSTFIHEMNHVFVHEYKRIIDSGKYSEQFLADYLALEKFAGGKFDRTGEEKIAAAWEAYLMQGKAPSVELAGAFHRFRNWLLQIYRSFKGQGVTINDEIRGVFDRMLASDEQIQEASDYYFQKDFLTHLTDDVNQINEVRAKRERAETDAKTKQAAQLLKAWVKALGGKDAIRKEAKAEIEGMAVHQILEGGERSGKISDQAVRESFGYVAADKLKAMHPKSVTDEAGETIEGLAAEYGFTSPESLMDSLLSTLPKDQAIEQRLGEMLLSKEDEFKGEILNDESLHSDHSTDFLIAQGQLLADKASKASGKKLYVISKIYQDSAREIIGSKKVAEATRPDLYLKAELKYARQAMKFSKAGRFEEALAAYDKQLLNHYLAKEAFEAKALREKIEKAYKPQKLSKLLAGVENDFIAPIIEVLSRYELTEQTNETPFDFKLLSDLDEGLSGMVPEFIETGKDQGDYRKTLTMDQLRELHEFVKTVDSVGTNRLKSLDADLQKTVEEAVFEAIGTMQELPDLQTAQKGKDNVAYVAQQIGRFFQAGILNQGWVSDWVDGLSRTKDGRIGAERNRYNQIVNREAKKQKILDGVQKKMTGSIKTLEKAAQRINREMADSLGDKARLQVGGEVAFEIPGLNLPEALKRRGVGLWTAQKLIALLLNTGNQQNLDTVMRAYKWTEQDLSKISQMFSSNELEAIQGIWDSIDTLYADMDQTFFSIYNRHTDKVDANPIALISNDGQAVTLKGGYYPLIFDHRVSKRAEEYREQDLMKNNFTSLVRAKKPKDGFTHSRQPDGSSLPPLLDMNVLFQHIEDTAHFTAMAESVRDFNKIFKNEIYRDTMEAKLGTDIYEERVKWLQEVARPQIIPSSKSEKTVNRLLNWSKSLAAVNMLGLKATTALIQYTSLLQVAGKIGLKNTISGIRQAGAHLMVVGTEDNPQWKAITEMSSYMATRGENIDFQVRQMISGLKFDNRFKFGPIEFDKKTASDIVFSYLRTRDRAVTSSTWLGAYARFMEDFKGESSHEEAHKGAVSYADSLVQDTQPSGFTTERNPFGSEKSMLRFFNIFMTYAFKYGGDQIMNLKGFQNDKKSAAEFVKYLLISTYGISLMEQSIRLLMSGNLWDEEKRPDWWQWLLAGPSNLLQPIPIVRDWVRNAQYAPYNATASDYLIGQGTLFMPIDKAFDAVKSTVKAASGDEDWTKAIWDTARAAEVFVGVPALNVAKDLMNAYHTATGQEKSDEVKKLR